jgi:thiol-disulfide isomerase/thioredoxin
LVIVSSEDVASNRAQGLRSPIVLDQEFGVGRAFGATGTPSAVLIDAEGRIASGIGVGAAEVIGLLRHQISPSSAAAALAEGANFEGDNDEDEDEEALPVPAIGALAPEVKLRDLDGALVDLAERRGRATALIFWDPDCGFCRQMAPALKRWEENAPPGAPTVALISEGSVEDNKAQGFRSLVLIDDDFAVGKSFGADGTPMAILLDAEGRVASDLVEGQDDVLTLLGGIGPTAAASEAGAHHD